MDEVDRILASWHREAPEVDLAPLALFSRVSRLSRHLDKARREAFSAHALEVWEFDVLTALRRSGAPYELSPGVLIRETLSTSGTMTNRIDRLATRGMVERRPDPNDRRGVRVRLTDTGVETVDRAITDLVDYERVILAEFSSDEVDSGVALLRRLLSHFEGNT